MEALETLTQAVYAACLVVTMRLWLRVRTRQAGWSALTFGALGGVVLVGLVVGEGNELPGVWQRLLIVVVLLIPWLLFRFADSVVAVRPGLRRVLDVVGITMAASTLLLPDLPDPDVPATRAQDVWLALVVGGWLVLAVVTFWFLWRAGREQPGVTRGRVRLLALGALLLGLTIVTSAGSEEDGAGTAVSHVFSMAAALTFLVGYAPPSPLRGAWRAEDERALHAASVHLLTADDVREVADALLPGFRRIIGSPGAIALDEHGRVLAADGAPVDPDSDDVEFVHVGPLAAAYLSAPAMPLFGPGEKDMVDRLSLVVRLAVDRVRHLEGEREARRVAEDARAELEEVNTELESFIYTASHDLKNPVIAILGYVEILQKEHGGQLNADGKHYLERMSVNASFMESLIRDLLELSRVGRIDVEPAWVDVTDVLHSLAQDVRGRHPETTLVVRPPSELPRIWINPVRARQLFENLVENACRYGRRDDIVVDVTWEADVDGGIAIHLRDNGAGIPDEQLDRIFGMFERLEPEGSDGTGMGLAICRRIIDALDGTIRAVPSQEGAHFVINLPVGVVETGNVDADHETPVRTSP